MSTNKTQHYHLHAWEAEDDFLREEINENFASLDAAMADQVAALTASIGKKAALVTGSYAGDRVVNKTIEVGYPIKALLLESSCGVRGSSGSSTVAGGLAFPGQPLGKSGGPSLTIDGTRFHITLTSDDPYLNLDKRTFVYLAWVEMG